MSTGSGQGQPNCYYELGFAHGVNRALRVILCCREDHLPDSPRFKAANKIHFDLQNHGLTCWSPWNLKRFERDLRETIEYRVNLIKRDEDAECAAEERRTADMQGIADQISRNLRATLDERLTLLTQREQARLAGT